LISTNYDPNSNYFSLALISPNASPYSILVALISVLHHNTTHELLGTLDTLETYKQSN
jgi:hypothetical protein